MTDSSEKPNVLTQLLDPNNSLIQGLLGMQRSGIRPNSTDEFLVDGKWECNKCGACCKDVSWCLPDWTVEDGKRCKYLADDLTCSIYEDRPDICRMNKWANPPDETIARNCAYMKELHEVEDAE